MAVVVGTGAAAVVVVAVAVGKEPEAAGRCSHLEWGPMWSGAKLCHIDPWF